MKFRLIVLALAACSLPAFATTTASVTTSGFGFTVGDLTPADGVAPGLVWVSDWTMRVNATYAAQTGYQATAYNWGIGLDAIYGGSQNASFSAGAPNTSLSGSAPQGVGSFAIDVGAGGLPAVTMQLSVGEGQSSGMTAYVNRAFVLTPGTQVTFTTLVDRHMSGPGYGGSLPVNIGAPSHSSTLTDIGMFAGGALSNELFLQASNDFFQDTAAYEFVGEGDALKLTIRNTGTSAELYKFSFMTVVSAQELLDPAAAVPEPSTYALMALGLVAVGAAARRKKS